MKSVPDKFYNLAIVDPPYGIGRDGHTSRINCKKAKHRGKAYEFKGWDKTTPDAIYFDELYRISKNQIIWGANYFTKYLPPSMGWIFWDKGQDLTMSDGEFAFTSFQVAARRKVINRAQIQIDGAIHPTQKPVALYKWILEKYAKPGDKIVDTHLGSGSIAIACYDYGFDLDACEIDEEYYNAALRRYKMHASQLKAF